MNCKQKIFLAVLLVFVLLNVAVVSANENVAEISNNTDETTILSMEPEEFENNTLEQEISDAYDENGMNATSNKLESTYSDTLSSDKSEAFIEFGNEIFYGDKFKIYLTDMETDRYLENVKIKVIFYETSSKYHIDYYSTNGYGEVSARTYGNVGSHKVIISVDDPIYEANSITGYLRILKEDSYVWANIVKTNTISYFYIKAIVKDSFNRKIREGNVIFKINGKTYKVKVKNGVATKKLTFNKKGTYKYKAIFSSKNYNKDYDSSKVVVKKVSLTIKKGKYRFTLTPAQYKRIQYVKKHRYDDLEKYANFKVKTKKIATVKKPIYSTIKVTKYKWKYIKVLSYWSRWGDDWYEDHSYDLTKYFKSGWDLYGYSDNEYSNGMDSYAKLKKKVRVTETKKVVVGYKKVQMPVYAVVTTYSGGHWDEYSDTFTPENYPQVQFIAMKNGYSKEYLTGHYML